MGSHSFVTACSHVGPLGLGFSGLLIIGSACGWDPPSPGGCGGELHDFSSVRISQGAESREVRQDPPSLAFLDPGQPIDLVWATDGSTLRSSSRGTFAVTVLTEMPADSGADVLCRDPIGGAGSGGPSAPSCPVLTFPPPAGETQDFGVRMDGFLGGHGYQVLLYWEITCGIRVVVDFDFFDRAFEPGDPEVSITRLP